ncbi:MAG: NosD domain-containing protein [Patescibacteria group bacterium]
MSKKLQKKFEQHGTSVVKRFCYAIALLFVYFFQSAYQSFALLFNSNPKSFNKLAFQEETGTYKDSYVKHKQFQSGVRYFTISSFLVIAVAAVAVFSIYSTIFPFKDIKPALAATDFTLNSQGDGPDAAPGDGNCADGGGFCTLRAAIQEINAQGAAAVPGPWAIQFGLAIDGATITPATALPKLSYTTNIHVHNAAPGSYKVYIDGSGCATPSCDGLQLKGANTTLNGEITATSGTGGIRIYGFPGDGVELSAASIQVRDIYIGTSDGTTDNGNTLNGVNVGATASSASVGANTISGNDQSGINVTTGSGHTIRNNYIGTSSDGTADLGNDEQGVYIADGDVTVEDNTISGNGEAGLEIAGGSSHSITGNYIGTNGTGAAAVANALEGIDINGGSTITIGGTGASDENIISGNTDHGVEIDNATGVTLQGNYIGTNAAGTAAIANGNEGVYINSCTTCEIGGTAANEGNIISGNIDNGIEANDITSLEINGNYIGTDINGTSALANGGEGIRFTGTVTNPDIEANIIAGNTDNGVVNDATMSGLEMYSNYIGVASDKTTDVANDNGVKINTSCSTCVIGSVANPNYISGNTSTGLYIANSPSIQIIGNYIGTDDSSGTTDVGNQTGISIYPTGDTANISDNVIAYNSSIGVGIQSSGGVYPKDETISQNSIFDNGTGSEEAGIYLASGTNNSIEPPVIYEADYNGTTTTISACADVGGTMEFFTDDNGSQGKTYLGNDTTDSENCGSINYAGSIASTKTITATITDSTGSTSTFGIEETTDPSASVDPAGGTYDSGQTITFTVTDDTDPNPFVNYTTDGTDPATSATVQTVENGDTIEISETTTLQYFAEDALSNTQSTQTEEYIISTPTPSSLSISNVKVTNIGGTYATVSWTTDKKATSEVEYGKTNALGSSKSDSTKTINHSIKLTGLDTNTKYYYKVLSTTSTASAESAIKNFTTYKQDIDPPVITYPKDDHFFTAYMEANDETIDIKISNPVIKKGRNKVNIDDVAQDNADTGKKYSKIGANGKSTFPVAVKDNDIMTNDLHAIDAIAKLKTGNTSGRSKSKYFTMASTHYSNYITFAPVKADRDPNLINTTTTSQPTIGSYFPGTVNPTVEIWRKNKNDSDYILDGNATNITGSASGIMNFSYKFFLPQPPGAIDVYFKVKKPDGTLQYTSEPFGLVYYKGCPANWQGAVDDSSNPYKPYLTFLMCGNQYYEVFIDDEFNGDGYAPGDGVVSVSYKPYVDLTEEEHNVTIRTWEEWGYPYSDIDTTIEVEAAEEEEEETGSSAGTPAFVIVPSEEEEELETEEEEGIEEGEEASIESVEEEIAELEGEEGTEEDVAGLEEELEDLISEEIGIIEEEIDTIEEEVAELEEEVAEKEQKGEDTTIEEEKIDELENKIDELNGQIVNLEDKLNKLPAKPESINTKKVIELSDEEEKELITSLNESLQNNTIIEFFINGQRQIIEGLSNICLKRCLYPSLANLDNTININGQIDLPETLGKKLVDAGAETKTAVDMGGVVKIATVNKTGEWTMSVPISELPEGQFDATAQASSNGSLSDEVVIAKVEAQKEPAISRTSILIFANVALGLIVIIVGGLMYRRRQQ